MNKEIFLYYARSVKSEKDKKTLHLNKPVNGISDIWGLFTYVIVISLYLNINSNKEKSSWKKL